MWGRELEGEESRTAEISELWEDGKEGTLSSGSGQLLCRRQLVLLWKGGQTRCPFGTPLSPTKGTILQVTGAAVRIYRSLQVVGKGELAWGSHYPVRDQGKYMGEGG